jgi:hypothetical protein
VALGLDRLLQADDGVALLLEGLLLARTRDAENQQLALELRELDVPPLQRLLRRLTSGMLPLERRPGVGKSGPLLLELPFSRGERSDLGVEGGLQLVGLLGLLLSRARPLLSLALLGLRLPEPRADLLVVSSDSAHLRLPVGCQRAHPLQILPRLLQRLVPIDEGRANLLEGGGALRILPFALLELVAQGLSLVRQPAVRGPQRVSKHVEGVAPLPELAKLDTHLVEGVILVTGAVLELLPPADQNQ